MAWITPCENHVLLQVLIIPRASRTEIVGVHDIRLKIKLNAPPVEGKANKALIEFLAKRLNLRKDQINILSGQSSRRKTLQICDLGMEEIQIRLK